MAFGAERKGGDPLRLSFVDNAPDVVDALRVSFVHHPEVAVIEGDILELARGALVSPANSYGYMDGGIDKLYVDAFGNELQRRVLHTIDRVHKGFVPVGSAVLVETGNHVVPFLIVAPTMETPHSVDPQNAYFSMAAILRLADRHPEVTEVYSPGLATGVGRVEPGAAAREMEAAYRKWKERSSSCRLDPAHG